MFLSLNQQRRWRPVFINCGSLSNRGLLLNQRKRERPVFRRCGSLSNRGLLLNRRKREAHLQQVRVTQQQRIATESTEEREARLQQVRSAQDRRIATESAEEREARLQQLRVAQQQRIATETSEEIEARRARDRRNHMDLKTAEVPLFQQTRVRFKMRQFHSRLKSVCVPRCVTKVSMHLSISHSLCSAVHSYDSLCRRSSRSPIMLSILLVYIDVRTFTATAHARRYAQT